MSKPICETCNDTHAMELRGAVVMCTKCPTPCQACRGDGNGPYCTVTPCLCGCHETSPKRPWSKPTLTKLVPGRVGGVVQLPLDLIPKAIRDSVRAVLKAHGFTIADGSWVGLDQREYEDILREIGNNATAALQGIDTNPENL